MVFQYIHHIIDVDMILGGGMDYLIMMLDYKGGRGRSKI